MNCPGCGSANDNGAKFCALCGKNLRFEPEASRVVMRGGESTNVIPTGKMASGKSAGLATVLSLFIVGAGQLYNRDVKKGFLMFGLAIVSGIFTMGFGWFGVAIWSAIDAYGVAAQKWPRW